MKLLTGMPRLVLIPAPVMSSTLRDPARASATSCKPLSSLDDTSDRGMLYKCCVNRLQPEGLRLLKESRKSYKLAFNRARPLRRSGVEWQSRQVRVRDMQVKLDKYVLGAGLGGTMLSCCSKNNLYPASQATNGKQVKETRGYVPLQ